jgi:predicted nucleic acid-binding Zn ribbon protein
VASHRFSSVKELLASAAGEVAKATGSTAALAPVWAEVVGPSIARNAWPVSLENGALIIEAESQQWADVLKHREADLKRQLQPHVRFDRLVVRLKR